MMLIVSGRLHLFNILMMRASRLRMPQRVSSPGSTTCVHFTPLVPFVGWMQQRKEDDSPKVPRWMVGFFLFVVVGGAIFQIVQSAMQGSPLSE